MADRTAREVYPHRHGGEFTLGTNGPECTACGLTANEFQLVTALRAVLAVVEDGDAARAELILESLGVCRSCGFRKQPCDCGAYRRWWTP